MVFLWDFLPLSDMLLVIFSLTWHIGFASTLNLLNFSCPFFYVPFLSFALYCTTKDYFQAEKGACNP